MRWVGTLFLACLAGAAMAQAPFTIVRPVDGSKVREKVKIEVPRNSVPPGGYMGLFLNGKFIEAVVPTPVGKFYDYTLDTKARGLADGKSKIELVLYVDYNDQPKIIDRSSVTVTIANKANIPIPKSGLKMRYRYQSGTELVYSVEHRLGLSSISAAQNRLGGRASQLPLDSQSFRLVYAVDNTYSDGDGLLRIYAQPPKGKSGIFLATDRNPSGLYWSSRQFGEQYMRVTNTGNEVFGSVPVSFPLEGTSQDPALTRELYYLEALPSLPTNAVHVGDVWQSRYQMDAMQLNRIHDLTSLVSPLPVRSEFVGVEWEMGHPCAKVHQSITAGERGSQGRGDFASDRVSIDQTYWYALDKKMVIKFTVKATIDRLSSGPAANGGTGSGGGAPVSGGVTARTGAPSLRGGGKGGGGFAIGAAIPGNLKQNGQRGPGNGFNPGNRFNPSAGQQQRSDPRNQARTTAAPANSAPQFIRITEENIYSLEG